MAGSFSDFLENELLDHVFGNAAYTAPATLYISAYTAAPTDAGGGTEVSGNAYARVAVTNNATNFPAASGGAKSNGVAIVFPTATPATWGSVVAIGIHDALTAGNLLGYDGAITPKTVAANDTLRIPIGDLDITLS